MKLFKLFIIFLVVFYPNITIAQQSKCEILKETIIQGDNELSEKIIASISDVDCDNKNSPLALACSYGNIKIVKMLLKKGANPNLMQYYNEEAIGTPLFDALSFCSEVLEPKLITPVKLDFKKNKKIRPCKSEIKDKIIRLLIENGADVNITEGDKTTTLMIASMYNRVKMIPLLIQKGVNVNTQNRYGNTALIYAVYSENYEAVKCLLDFNADVKLKDNNGKSIIDIAKEKKLVNILSLLTQY